LGLFRRHPVRDDALSAYLDGALRGDALSRVERHLETCERCRAAVDELRAVRGALQELPRERAPRSFALRRADIEAPRPAPPPGLLRASPMLGAVATIALLAFFSLVGLDVAAGPSGGGSRASGTFPMSLEAMESAADNAAPPDDGEQRSGFNGLGPDVDATAAPRILATGAEAPTSEPALPSTGPEADATSDEDGDGRTGLRAAEAATAAVALVAGGTFAVAWRRRRV